MSQIRAALAAIDAKIAAGPCAPTWESIIAHHQIPPWYQDAKFGIFIHWGIYSVPAFGNEWYARNMYLPDQPAFEHHLKTWGSHDRFGYKDFIPLFKAEQFDPDAWASLFKEAGARYVVPVAEHHDGFPMYDCPFTEWSARRMGPKRDVIGELGRAVRAAGLNFGVSSHRAENYWFFSGGRKIASDVSNERYRGLYNVATDIGDFHGDVSSHPGPPPDHLGDWLARTCDLIDRYEPSLIYFDWWIEHKDFEPHLRKLASYYYNHGARTGQAVVINYKLNAFPPGAAVFDVERGQLAEIRQPYWQTDTSVSKTSWGYVSNHDYKSATTIVHDLIDIVSKNGGLLLNIGPKPDGTIPPVEVEMLRLIGRWLRANGEAIYGSRPWRVFGEGPTLIPGGGFTDGRRVPFTSADIRFTQTPAALYAILLGWPADGAALIRSIGASDSFQTLSLLGSDEPLTWRRSSEGLHIQLPRRRPGEHAWTIKLTR
jgi:alpha-L-fucosidase